MAQPTAITSVRQAFAQVYIIDLAGELTSSVEAALLDAYQKASIDGARVVILNFSQLAYKNSSGIKLLVTLLMRGGAASICRRTERGVPEDFPGYKTGSRNHRLSFRSRRLEGGARPAGYTGLTTNHSDALSRAAPIHRNEATRK
jgi:ABC-type transporter Mla MlaB component